MVLPGLPNDFTVKGLNESSNIRPTILKARDYLDKLPFKELVSSVQLATAIGNSPTNFYSSFSGDSNLSDYRERIRNKYYFGSKETIIELRKRLEN